MWHLRTPLGTDFYLSNCIDSAKEETKTLANQYGHNTSPQEPGRQLPSLSKPVPAMFATAALLVAAVARGQYGPGAGPWEFAKPEDVGLSSFQLGDVTLVAPAVARRVCPAKRMRAWPLPVHALLPTLFSGWLLTLLSLCATSRVCPPGASRAALAEGELNALGESTLLCEQLCGVRVCVLGSGVSVGGRVGGGVGGGGGSSARPLVLMHAPT